MEIKKCPGCGNHCEKGSFKCNKGAIYFSKLQIKEKIKKYKDENIEK